MSDTFSNSTTIQVSLVLRLAFNVFVIWAFRLHVQQSGTSIHRIRKNSASTHAQISFFLMSPTMDLLLLVI
jgi:hypothetical protein